jgi:hypothetical protein
MSGPSQPISELTTRIEQKYMEGDPVRLHLSGHHPDFEVDSLEPVDMHEYISGSPSLIGRFPVRTMAVVEEQVVSIFQGRGYYVSRTFGIVNTARDLNGLFRQTDLPYRISEHQ